MPTSSFISHRKRRTLLLITTIASLLILVLLWSTSSLPMLLLLPPLTYLPFSIDTLPLPPQQRQPRQLSPLLDSVQLSSTALAPPSNGSLVIFDNKNHSQKLLDEPHLLVQKDDERFLAATERANISTNQRQFYWIATHFRSGSTLLSTLLSIPQHKTIFLFEPLHFLQPSYISSLRDYYDAHNNFHASSSYNFSAMSAAVSALRFASSSNRTSSTTSNANNVNNSSILADDDDVLLLENYALFRAIPDTADLRRLSTQLIMDIVQCRIRASPEARIYYLTDGFVNFDPNLARLKARWRHENADFYIQLVEDACRRAQRLVIKTIRADLQLVLDVVTRLRDLFGINIHVVHLWRHPLASVNSAFGRTSVRPFIRWVRMFCHVLYMEDYLMYNIVRQQLDHRSLSVDNSQTTTNKSFYTRIFYEDLIARQRRDPRTLPAMLAALGVDVTREHRDFIADNFNSNCEPQRPGAKRRDQGSFALCRTRTFDPHHWKLRKNKTLLSEWSQACRPAVKFYEAEFNYWQQLGKDRAHGFYPV